jgi:hypothetical protein
MATINQLSRDISPALGDSLPIFSNSNGNTQRITVNDLAAYILSLASSVYVGATGPQGIQGVQGPSGTAANVIQNVTQAQLTAGVALTGNNLIVETLTANLVIASPTGMVAGTFYTWRFQQNATGGLTVTFPNGVTYGSGIANQKLIVQFYYDGTDFLQVFGGA